MFGLDRRARHEAVFGRYRLIEPIGAGGMGVVYRALVQGPQGFRRNLAIKRMRPELSGSTGFVESLITEAQLAARLHHPNIAQVFDFGEVDGEYYLAMEYIDGVNLSALIRAGIRAKHPIPVALVCYLVGEAAAALEYAHTLCDEEGRALEIVHRDVTPSNIMITASGRVKLLDFGVAKAAERVRSKETELGVMKGKLRYMSPEQAEAHPIDRRSDVFSLGIVAHEALVGRPLFQGESDLHTLRLVEKAVVHGPSRYRPDVPADVEAIVLKMLARDREARYQSAQQVVEALVPVVHRLQGDAEGVRRLLEEMQPHLPKNEPGDPASEASGTSHPSGEIARATRRYDPPTPSFRRWLVPVGVALALGIVAMALQGPPFRSEGDKTAAVPTPPAVRPLATPLPAATPPAAPALAAQPLAEVAPTPAAPSQTVTVTVRGTRGGEVSIDRKRVGRIPLSLKLPRRQGTRRITIRRPGFATFASTLKADENASLNAILERSPTRRKTGEPIAEPIKDPFSR